MFKEAVYSSFHFVWKNTNRVTELQFLMLKYVCPNDFGTGDHLKSSDHLGCAEWSSPAPAVALLSAEGRGVLCVHGHRAVQPVEFHHTDHCCAQEGALESPLGQGKAG